MTAILVAGAVAQTNLSEALLEIPKCATNCAVAQLIDSQCELTNFQQCLCSNTTLQSQVAGCAFYNCSIPDQEVTASIFQEIVCKGFPVPSRSGEVIRTCTIVSAIAFPIVILRYLSRRVISTYIWWDDWFALIAVLLMIPGTTILTFISTKGFGKHFWDIPPSNYILLRKLYYVTQINYALTQNLAKFSILFLYLRIFPDCNFRLTTKLALAWIFCRVFAFEIALIFQCVPVAAVWDLTIKGKCINSQAIVFAGAGFSIAEDIMLMLLPASEIKGLSLSLKKKITCIFIFALGSFACITSIVRLKFAFEYGRSIDLTWDNIDLVKWSIIETHAGLICACLFTLKPLFVKYIPSLLSTESKTPVHPDAAWSLNLFSTLQSRQGGDHTLAESLHSVDPHA